MKSLTYSLYLRDCSTGRFLTFPDADIATGKRRVSRMGNVWLNRSIMLRNLPEGSYEWGVQTVDAGMRGSIFKTGETFSIAAGSGESNPAE